MNKIHYMSVVDALLLLHRKNVSRSGIDSSCVQVELFNKLLEWGYIELLDGNSGLRITEKGNNIIRFSTKNMSILHEAAIEASRLD